MEPSSSSIPRRGGLRQRIFAWMMSHSRSTTDAIMEVRRRALLRNLYGNVLEIGPGTGPNLRFFPAGVRWVGIEPNPYMRTYLEQTIQNLGLPRDHFRIDPGDPYGVRLPVEDESMDAVVSTHVLCSVPHLEESLREIMRVLKPGGRFVFIEHVAAARGSRLRKSQNFIQPVWTWAGDGCHPNRETWETIAQAGFARVEIEHFDYPDGGLVKPHIAGAALKG